MAGAKEHSCSKMLNEDTVLAQPLGHEGVCTWRVTQRCSYRQLDIRNNCKLQNRALPGSMSSWAVLNT